MTKKQDRIQKAYQFFCQAEEDNRVFTVQDIVDATGWAISTVKSYRTKKWYKFLKDTDNGLICVGIVDIAEDVFARFHAQRLPDQSEAFERPRFTEDVDTLIDKCREASLLAIQTYNNPMVQFRTPGYIVQMVIAYTALFHAIFERDNVEYWYKNDDGTDRLEGGDKRYWELSTCYKHYFQGNTTPETENLRFFVEIRNKVEHRFVPALDLTISGHCQALLMNFERLLVKEFGSYFALGQGLALALQITEYSKEQQEALKAIQAEQYNTIRTFIDQFQSDLPGNILSSGDYCFRAFLIPRLGNHASSSDLSVEFVRYDANDPEAMAQYEQVVAFIKPKLKQVDAPGHLRPKAVVDRVQQQTGLNFRMYEFINAWKLYEIRPNSGAEDPYACQIKYCTYNDAFQDYSYTQEFIDFLVGKIQDPVEFERIRMYRRS